MDKLQVKDQSKVKIPEEKTTTNKTTNAIATKIRKDGNKVNSLNLIDQNHNNASPMNYNCRTNGKPNGKDIRKIISGDITTDTIAKTTTSTKATKKIGNLRDYQANNDSDNKGPTKQLDSVIIDTQPIQKSWQAAMAGAKAYQQYHGQIVAHMLQNGYSPISMQVNITAIVRHC
ncbi:unnamed protein product [Onchocerca flexuosa]|uniref:SLT_2 domain-containing protein n=1 Tax=Onchocerca flexuosa TaxID=387005 RepID=A0A183HLK9_9BILA|nr:unnamed protein product [Onchocerca flexuosa]